MDNKKCPLCGNEIHDDNAFCQDCRQIAQDELPEGFYERDVNGEEVEEESTNSHNNEEPKAVGISSNNISRKKSSIVRNIILLILGGGILLAAGWYAAKEVIENKASDQTETIFWNTCEEENTLLAYSKYLVKYPEGQYASLAESKIEEFHAIEKDEWAQIQQMDDIADLIGYSRANLGTSYQGEISRKIDSLAWVKAKSEGSKTAYQFYLDNVALGFFLGNHKEEAQTLFGAEEVAAVVSEPQKVVEEVKIPVSVTGKDLDDISKRIYDLADNISRFRFDRAKKQMVPTLDNYFGMRKKTASTILSEFKNDMYKKGIKTQGYYILPKSLNVKVDDKGTYFVEVKVQKKITYISSKKKPVDEYLSLKIELSKNKLVQSIDKS